MPQPSQVVVLAMQSLVPNDTHGVSRCGVHARAERHPVLPSALPVHQFDGDGFVCGHALVQIEFERGHCCEGLSHRYC